MERTYSWDELLRAGRQRWKHAAIAAAVVFAVGMVAVLRAPAEYRARATVMVEPLRPHPDLVTPVISTTLEDRVKSVRAQVYARSLMASAIEELDLYPDLRKKDGMDAAIEALRADTAVNAEGEDTFSIAVRGGDAVAVAKTANRLAELVIEGNLQVRNGQVARTRDIIVKKLEDLRGQLSTAEGKVTAFKQAHASELPDLMEARMREREQLSKQIEMQNNFIEDAQRRVDLFHTQPWAKDTEVGRAAENYDALKAKLSVALSTLTPDNPDVLELRREVGNAKALFEAAKGRAEADDLEKRRMVAAMSRGQQAIAAYQKRIEAIDKTVALSPVLGQQLAELTHDADLLRAKVTQLISKRAEAELSADLETKNAQSEFRVLESAVAPQNPAAPNRAQGTLFALLAALGIGAAVAVGEEMSDRSLRSPAEVGAELHVPVLATVPRLSGLGSAMPMSLSTHKAQA